MRVETLPGSYEVVSDRANPGIPRWADATVAAIMLAISSPLLALLALGVAVTSGLPVFFRQKRVGRYGEDFVLYKLRTMTISTAGPQITSGKDTRITPFGRFLRKTKLDELPTFWNVLRGDVALVGPRPEVPAYVNLNDPLWRAILSVRPGLTDPTTVSLRNEEDLLARAEPDPHTYYVTELQPAKLEGYIEYLRTRNLRSDIKVLGRTVTAIVRH